MIHNNSIIQIKNFCRFLHQTWIQDYTSSHTMSVSSVDMYLSSNSTGSVESDSMPSPSSSITDSASSNNGSPPAASATADKPKRRTKRTRQRSPETVQRIKKTRRNKANNRERNRMHDLNDALDKLRLMLPTGDEDTKLTKIETLRYVTLSESVLHYCRYNAVTVLKTCICYIYGVMALYFL